MVFSPGTQVFSASLSAGLSWFSTSEADKIDSKQKFKSQCLKYGLLMIAVEQGLPPRLGRLMHEHIYFLFVVSSK